MLSCLMLKTEDFPIRKARQQLRACLPLQFSGLAGSDCAQSWLAYCLKRVIPSLTDLTDLVCNH